MFSFKYLQETGLRSFANTMHLPFRAAGTANGPTPAKTSHISSLGLNMLISLWCSPCSLLFQYTFEKSNLNEHLSSFISAIMLLSPANTSISKNRNVFSMFPVLFTTERICALLSSMTCAMMCLYGPCSSRKFTCAMCPTVSNEQGTSISSGNIDRSI
jgi:hypothetical protein